MTDADLFLIYMDFSQHPCLFILNASLGFKENCFERFY